MNFNNNDLKKNLSLALANLEENNFDQASNIYKKILKKYPNNFDANFNLGTIFAKNNNEATQIMYHVHKKGIGVCGVYPYEVAETKVVQVMEYAKKHQHPLQCTLEKE